MPCRSSRAHSYINIISDGITKAELGIHTNYSFILNNYDRYAVDTQYRTKSPLLQKRVMYTPAKHNVILVLVDM